MLDGAGNDDGSSRFAFTSTTSDYFTKGESFTLAESADLSAITIRVDENTAINDIVGDVTLRVYNLSGVPDDTQATRQLPTNPLSPPWVSPNPGFRDLSAPPPTPAREAPGNQSWKSNFLAIG